MAAHVMSWALACLLLGKLLASMFEMELRDMRLLSESPGEFDGVLEVFSGSPIDDRPVGFPADFAEGQARDPHLDRPRTIADLGTSSSDAFLSSDDRPEDLCDYFQHLLTDDDGLYLPARPRWRGDGAVCEQMDFVIGKQIGAGGFGAVFRGTHLKTGTLCAFKFLRASLGVEEHSLVRVEECLQTKVHGHPNIVKHYCTFIADTGAPVLVTELVEDSVELLEIARERTRDTLTGERVYRYMYDPLSISKIAAQLIGALRYMHSVGVVYRDLKPENVMVNPDTMKLKLLDFGIAADPLRLVPSIHDSLLGTLQFVPPEFLDKYYSGPFVTEAADWYALGIVLYELSFRRSPFPEGSLGRARISSLIKKGVSCPKAVDADWLDCCSLIEQLCNPDPVARLGAREDSDSTFTRHPFLIGSGIKRQLFMAYGLTDASSNY